MSAKDDPPVQLPRRMIDDAIMRSAQHIAPAIAPVGQTQRRALLANGAMKRFLAHARAVQRLPSLGKRMRS